MPQGSCEGFRVCSALRNLPLHQPQHQCTWTPTEYGLDTGCKVQDTGQGTQASLGRTGPSWLLLSLLDQCPEDVIACAYFQLCTVCICVHTLPCMCVLGVRVYACEPELLLPQRSWPALPQGPTLHRQNGVLGRLTEELEEVSSRPGAAWVGVHRGAGSGMDTSSGSQGAGSNAWAGG